MADKKQSYLGSSYGTHGGRTKTKKPVKPKHGEEFAGKHYNANTGKWMTGKEWYLYQKEVGAEIEKQINAPAKKTSGEQTLDSLKEEIKQYKKDGKDNTLNKDGVKIHTREEAEELGIVEKEEKKDTSSWLDNFAEKYLDGRSIQETGKTVDELLGKEIVEESSDDDVPIFKDIIDVEEVGETSLVEEFLDEEEESGEPSGPNKFDLFTQEYMDRINSEVSRQENQYLQSIGHQALQNREDIKKRRAAAIKAGMDPNSLSLQEMQNVMSANRGATAMAQKMQQDKFGLINSFYGNTQNLMGINYTADQARAGQENAAQSNGMGSYYTSEAIANALKSGQEDVVDVFDSMYGQNIGNTK